jgi:hypothetical protein
MVTDYVENSIKRYINLSRRNEKVSRTQPKPASLLALQKPLSSFSCTLQAQKGQSAYHVAFVTRVNSAEVNSTPWDEVEEESDWVQTFLCARSS